MGLSYVRLFFGVSAQSRRCCSTLRVRQCSLHYQTIIYLMSPLDNLTSFTFTLKKTHCTTGRYSHPERKTLHSGQERRQRPLIFVRYYINTAVLRLLCGRYPLLALFVPVGDLIWFREVGSNDWLMPLQGSSLKRVSLRTLMIVGACRPRSHPNGKIGLVAQWQGV